MPDAEEVRSLDLAQRDLADIQKLREFEPFTRYWVRRMNDRYKEINERFHHDGPQKCDDTQREALRQILEKLDELMDMMDTDERTCRDIIQRAPPR